ncbi:MAG: hypothetical protein KJZ85_09680 [Rhodobacteraceae bacterium]|jgi:hypothetical protein|nr:hypothetical protein [Paracoccaceae bacterium]
MRKRLVLHIGSHKTGTTHIQSTLARNAAVLERIGVLYPQAGRIHEAHFRLCWQLKDRKLKQSALASLPDWAALQDEIDAAPQPVAVVSSEEFGLGLDPARLAPLAERYDVAVVFYLRSPDSYLESFYNQFVKDFETREARTIDRYLAEERLHFLETARILRPWAELFGDAALRVRLFDRVRAAGGLMADFLDAIGCTERPAFGPPGPVVHHKASLPPDALEYVRAMNPWLTRPDGHHKFVVRLSRMAQARSAELQQTRAGLLSLAGRQALRSRFADANRKAARAYLGVDANPFPPDEAPAPPADFDARLSEATAAVVGKVAAFLKEYVDEG